MLIEHAIIDSASQQLVGANLCVYIVVNNIVSQIATLIIPECSIETVFQFLGQIGPFLSEGFVACGFALVEAIHYCVVPQGVSLNSITVARCNRMSVNC